MTVSFVYGQATVTLNGVPYQLTGHPRVFFDGPSGAITTGIKDPDGKGKKTAPKAVSTNPPWVAVQTRAQVWATYYPWSDLNQVNNYKGGAQAAMFAAYWYSDNSQTAYHDAALSMLNHIEQYFPLFCDETQQDCVSDGGTGYYVGSYGVIFWLPQWLYAYELMRGEMTVTQQQAFADKVLNDFSAFGGVGGSPNTSCTNPTQRTGVSVTVANGVITAASPLFGSGNTIQLGDWVAMDGGGGYNIGHIVAIADSQHATISSTVAGSWNGYNGTISTRRNSWVAGDCGILWVGKHGRFAPPSLAYVNGATAYPPWGGQQAGPASNNTFAYIPQVIAAFLSVIDDDVNAAQRSQMELTKLYSDWYTNIWSDYVEHGYTGFHYTGSNYGLERPVETMKVPAMLDWSINGTGPPIDQGVWAKNVFYQYFMNWLPGCASVEPQFGQDFAINAFGGFSDPGQMANATMLYAFYRNTNEGKWFNWALRNRLSVCGAYGNTPGSNLFWTANGIAGASVYAVSQWEYTHTDPSWPASDLSKSGPTAAALNQVDAPSGGYPQSVLISRTGYSNITDTLINFYGMYEQTNDHNYPGGGWYPGTYKIFKGNFLQGSDGLNSTYASVYNNYHNGGGASNYLEIGGTSNLPSYTVCGATMPDANTDSQNNRYAYALVDSTKCYVPAVNAIRVQRHLADFKGGSQQYIVVYDDVQTRTGSLKRAYLHYPNNFGAANDKTRGATTVTGTSILSSNPGTGHGDATQLLTQVLAPGPNQIRVYTDNPNGTYPGGNGSTFRVSVCASADGTSCDATNTATEFITIHEPVAGTQNALPPIAMIATDPNWRGVQVGGSSPKIALFASKGLKYATASFTSTYSGTAQILIAGLQPGTYNVNGPTPASGTVGSDGVLYFEGRAGSYTVAAGSPDKVPLQGQVAASGQVQVH